MPAPPKDSGRTGTVSRLPGSGLFNFSSRNIASIYLLSALGVLSALIGFREGRGGKGAQAQSRVLMPCLWLVRASVSCRDHWAMMVPPNPAARPSGLGCKS